MKLKINNNYKCFMLTPSVNFWYDEGLTIFIGWLCWGVDIVIKENKDEANV